MTSNQKVQSDAFLKLVKKCNSFYENLSGKNFREFHIENKKVGLVRLDILEQLRNYPDVFCIGKKTESAFEPEKVELNPELSSPEERSAKVDLVLQNLREKHVFKTLDGWRNEEFDVWCKLSEPVLMKMERSATCLFGLKQCGVHINGFTHHPEKGLCMWVGKRAKTKPTWPGMLDQIAAGGLSAGESIMEAARRECQEEASVPDHILDGLKHSGCISYMFEDERGVFPEIQYILDLEVPPNFVPENADGEVESFQLIPVKKMKDYIVENNFKFNCAVVVLDFLIRHGHITPDNEPHYWELVRWLHDPLF